MIKQVAATLLLICKMLVAVVIALCVITYRLIAVIVAFTMALLILPLTTLVSMLDRTRGKLK